MTLELACSRTEDSKRFNLRLAAFIEAAQSVIDVHMASSFPNAHYVIRLSVEGGSKYIKIVRREFDKATNVSLPQVSVHCFVDSTNGDVLKAATWNAPAKHARGNIFAPDFGKSAMTPYGTIYLK